MIETQTAIRNTGAPTCHMVYTLRASRVCSEGSEEWAARQDIRSENQTDLHFLICAFSEGHAPRCLTRLQKGRAYGRSYPTQRNVADTTLNPDISLATKTGHLHLLRTEHLVLCGVSLPIRLESTHSFRPFRRRRKWPRDG